MKASTVRKIDTMGRIALPRQLRRELDLKEGDEVQLFTEGRNVIMKPHEISCIICGEADSVIMFNGRVMCKACVDKLTK